MVISQVIYIPYPLLCQICIVNNDIRFFMLIFPSRCHNYFLKMMSFEKFYQALKTSSLFSFYDFSDVQISPQCKIHILCGGKHGK